MEAFKQFFIDNWQWLVSVVSAVLSVIIFICKKKGINGSYIEVLELISESLPDYIIQAESQAHTGAEKKQFVLDKVARFVDDIDPIYTKSALKYADKYIEAILKTPVKKGGIGREEKIK